MGLGGILGMGGNPWSTKTLETSLAKIASRPALVMHSNAAIFKHLRSSTISTSSSQLS
jgi:hypothetical protein